MVGSTAEIFRFRFVDPSRVGQAIRKVAESTFNNEEFSGEAFSAVACSQIRYFDHFWIALVNGDSKLTCKWVSV